jgi:hypothetical protein
VLLSTGLVSAAECAVGEMGVLDNTRVVDGAGGGPTAHEPTETLHFHPLSERFLQVHKGERPDASHNIRGKLEPAHSAPASPGRTLPSVRTIRVGFVPRSAKAFRQGGFLLADLATLARECARELSGEAGVRTASPRTT